MMRSCRLLLQRTRRLRVRGQGVCSGPLLPGGNHHQHHLPLPRRKIPGHDWRCIRNSLQRLPRRVIMHSCKAHVHSYKTLQCTHPYRSRSFTFFFTIVMMHSKKTRTKDLKKTMIMLSNNKKVLKCKHNALAQN